MDFPVYHIDFFGNRMLVAGIAILHVLINHSFAVGGVPLINAIEWWGRRKGDPHWDELARKVLFVCFIVTTSAGALTGVGIWLSVALVNPYAIGSLIRVFFWALFFEWLVFVTEVCLILAYFLTWKKWTGEKKLAHIRLGITLSVFSWLTMAVIVAILGFMMDPGAWQTERSFMTGVFNPIYLPQLAFRTPGAMVMAGTLGLFLTLFFTERGSAFRREARRFISLWMLVWSVPFLAGCVWYRAVIPGFMAKHLPTALGTMKFEALYDQILVFTFAALGAILLVALWGSLKPSTLPRWAWAAPLILVVVLIGQFERAREFIRKPYVIGGYVYANGIRVSDVPLLMKEGLLPNSSFTSVRSITPENRLRAGKDVFMVACSRCHTLNGVNAVTDKLENMYGAETEWNADAVDSYLATMFGARPYMPPFPGTAEERKVLAEYLVSLQSGHDTAEGVQTVGLPGGEE